METCTSPHVKQTAGGDLLWTQGAQSMPCEHLEGWDVVGGGREGLCISIVRNTADPQITDSPVHCFSFSHFPYDLNKRINSLEKGLYL